VTDNGVVNDLRAPAFVPFEFVALTLNQYVVPGLKPVTDAETETSVLPAVCDGVTGGLIAVSFVTVDESVEYLKVIEVVVSLFAFTVPFKVAVVVSTEEAATVTGVGAIVKSYFLPK
jgi:hypothetical protein